MNRRTLTLAAVGILVLGLAAGKLAASLTTSAPSEIKILDNSISAPVLTNTILPTFPRASLRELNLTGDRQVFITGEIGQDNSQAISKQILELGKDPAPMTIVINSPGGSVFDGAEIISAIEAAKGPVNTLCVQLCASMAAMIHQYGTNRLMLNRAVLMFHPAAGGLQGTIDQMNSRLRLFQSFIGKMEQHVAKRAGTTYQDYFTRTRVELWLDAEDSVAQNYADGIVFVRGKDGSKLYQGFGSDMKRRNETPAVIPNPNNPIENPKVETHDWMKHAR